MDYPRRIREVHIGNGDHDEYTWEEPVVGGMYSIGADWAKEKDKTVIAILRTDVKPRRLVRLIRINRRPWPFMIDLFNTAIRDYHANAFHDGTGRGQRGQRLRRPLRHAAQVRHGRAAAHRAAAGLHHRLRARRLPACRCIKPNVEYQGVAINPMYRAHRSTTVADVYAPGQWNSHLPDDMAAMALAHRAAEHLPQPVHEGFEIPKDGVYRRADQAFHAVPGDDGTLVEPGGRGHRGRRALLRRLRSWSAPASRSWEVSSL